MLVFAAISLGIFLLVSCAGISHTAIDTLFIGLTMNAVACFRDLGERFRNLDNDSESSENRMFWGDRSTSENCLNMKIILCIRLHKKYNEYAFCIGIK